MWHISVILLFFANVICASKLTGTQRLSADCVISEFNQVGNITQNCIDISIKDLIIPAGQTLILDLLEGATVTFTGTTTFEFVNWDGPLMIIYGNGVTVQGDEDHVINGSGELYWDGGGSWGSAKPKFLIITANNSIFQNLHFHNAPKHGLSISQSNDVILTDILIDNADGTKGIALAGFEGHNTDGFGVEFSTNIIIKNSRVYNQDDCVVLNSGSNIHVSNMLCHGSHGLSISVGFSNDSIETNSLRDVVIEDSVIMDAMTGIHIKTHRDVSAPGLVENVTYRNIFMIGSYQYGISIEQNYTNTQTAGQGALPTDNIPINSLYFKNVRGTVLNTAIPYYIVCAVGACENWQWKDVFVSGHHTSACVNFHPDGIECIESTL